MQPNEKFRLAQVETNKICGVLPEKRQTDYDSWLLKVKEFRGLVENDIVPNFSALQGRVKSVNKSCKQRIFYKMSVIYSANILFHNLHTFTVSQTSTPNAAHSLSLFNGKNEFY